MSMNEITRSVGRAALGVVTVVSACAPTIIELEHAGSGGTAGSVGSAGDVAGTGTEDGGEPGSAGGSSTGGTGAASGGTGAQSGQAGTGTASGGARDDLAPECSDRPLTDVQNGHDLLPGYTAPRDPRVDEWLSAMTLRDRFTQMQGVPVGDKDYQDISRSPDLELANGTVLRGYRYRPGPRGATLDAGQDNRPKDANNFSTAFPTQSIRGASWNLELEWLVGEAIGDEIATSMNNLLIGPQLDVSRHPYWGLVQDSYGEDTYHVGRMGSAFVAGAQSHVAACATHFLMEIIERNRSNQNSVVDEQTLREVFARPFEMVVQDGGVACVMAAYSKVNDIKMAENAHLLSDILKAPVAQNGIGFRGFTISDWWALPGDQGPVSDSAAVDIGATAAAAGLDVELPWTLHYGNLLLQSAETNPGTRAAIDEAAARVLEQKARFDTALTTDPWGLGTTDSALDGASIATNETHLALAERAASESAVLLGNGSTGSPVLPIPASVRSVAVIGATIEFDLLATSDPKSGNPFHFETDVAVGDRGTSRVNADPTFSVGPFAGIQSAGSRHAVTSIVSGSDSALAQDADFAVVVVGYTPGDEGEEYAILSGGDRSSFDLPHAQNELVNSVLSYDKPTVIVVESGSAVNLPWLAHENQNQATVWAGYGGMRGGAALGKLLFGEVGFSGKLPFAWPRGSVPLAFAGSSDSVEVSYFFGYREYDRLAAAGQPVDLQFPFGHGLSYTEFEYSGLSVPCQEVSSGAVLDVTVDVKNSGPVAGDEVAFLFVSGPPSEAGPRPVKELKSFARVSLAKGETRTVHLPLRIQDLKHWNGDANGSWVIDPGTYTISVGPSGDDADLARNQATFTFGN